MRQYFLLHGGSPLSYPQQFSCDGHCIESTPMQLCPGRTSKAIGYGSILCLFILGSALALLNLPTVNNSYQVTTVWIDRDSAAGYSFHQRNTDDEAEPSERIGSPYCESPCNSHIILHGKSSADIGNAFNRTGPPLHLADIFMVPDSAEAECRGVVSDVCTYTAVGILNVKVFEFSADGEKLVGPAFQQQKREQISWYRKLTGRGVVWSCVWQIDGTERPPSDAVPPEIDTHSHSLAVQCPAPAEVLLLKQSACGQLGATLSLRAASSATEENLFSISTVPVCASAVDLPGSPLRASVESSAGLDKADQRQYKEHLGACTMVTELDAMFDTATLTLLWTEYMLANGVESVLVYVDANQRDGVEPPRLEVDIAKKLSHHIKSGQVEIVLFHLNGRGWLETQQMMETHCIWRYRNRAKWVIHDDIDEFMQPLVKSADGTRARLVDTVHHLETEFPLAAAFQVRQSFWGHLPSESIAKDSLALWNMTWRSSGPFKGGREKLIFQPGQISYISVHSVTGGPRPIVPDPENIVRLNHFRRHFKGLGPEDATPSWRNSGIGPSPVQDTSFLEFWRQLGLPVA